MSVKLNNRAFEYAIKLIEQGAFVFDQRDMWSEHQPSAQDENEYLKAHGFGEYRKWYLGIDTGEDEDTKGRYKFPYGDFEKVHHRSRDMRTRGSRSSGARPIWLVQGAWRSGWHATQKGCALSTSTMAHRCAS